MEAFQLPVKLLREGAQAPKYMSDGAAGMDFCSCLEETVTLQPGERKLIPTGVAMAIPQGFEGQVRPRSGLAIKHGITLVNAPGTIDSDYRGEVQIIMMNQGSEPFEVTHGMRIAQIIFARYSTAAVEEVEDLDETVRGGGGFGHTGLQSKHSS